MVRKATLNDILTLDAMAERTVSTMHAKGLDQWSASYPRRTHFEADVQAGVGYVYDDGKIKGYFALITHDPYYDDIPWQGKSGVAVHRIFTDPLNQRTGTAKAMMMAIIQEAKNRGLESIWIDTHPANDAMRAFLHYFQFQERGFIDAIYRIAYERPTLLTPPQKILIFGNSGVGKTTLSKKLSEKLNIPYVHLDSLYWLENWQSTPRQQFIEKVDAFIDAHPTFVMDGNYMTSGTLESRLKVADTLIFLDYPTQMALNGIKQREKTYHGRARSDMADGCIEKIDQEFLTYVLNFNETRRPSILELLQSHQRSHQTFRFSHRPALNTFLESL